MTRIENASEMSPWYHLIMEEATGSAHNLIPMIYYLIGIKLSEIRGQILCIELYWFMIWNQLRKRVPKATLGELQSPISRVVCIVSYCRLQLIQLNMIQTHEFSTVLSVTQRCRTLGFRLVPTQKACDKAAPAPRKTTGFMELPPRSVPWQKIDSSGVPRWRI